jgi:hypothetical protein
VDHFRLTFTLSIVALLTPHGLFIGGDEGVEPTTAASNMSEPALKLSLRGAPETKKEQGARPYIKGCDGFRGSVARIAETNW